MFDAEYSDIITLPPVRVDQEFVDDLIRKLRSNVDENKDLKYDITVKVGKRSFSRDKILDIIHELKSNDIDELIIKVRASAKSDFDPWMTVSLTKNRSILQISSNNEIFFRGKINQIFDFFSRKKALVCAF